MKRKGALENHNRSFRNQLFVSVLTTYLLMLLITLSMLAIGYGYSIYQARTDIETVQIVFLKKIQNEIDIHLTNVKEINELLAAHPLTKEVSAFEEETAKGQYAFKDLKEVLIGQNKLIQGQGKSVLYFSANQSILTSSRRYSRRNLDAYTKQIGLTAEEFLAFMDSAGSFGAYQILHPDSPDAELMHLTPILNESYQRVGMVMTSMSMSFLNDSLGVEDWMEGSICCMVNDSGSLYIGSDAPERIDSFAEITAFRQVESDARPRFL